jgi:hypothetical protein
LQVKHPRDKEQREQYQETKAKGHPVKKYSTFSGVIF